MKNKYKILVGKPEGKRSLGRHRRIWEDNIKIHLEEIWCEVVDWIHVAYDRIPWRVINLLFP
jgi:hypothetical protein